MSTTTAVTASVKRPARHFDRGFRSGLRSSVPAIALLAACSGAGSGGGAGGAGGTCGASSGAGNCVVTGGTGGGDRGGTTGVGGSGGSAPLPACPVIGPMFGVCFVNDAEGVPIGGTTATTSGAATIEAVGSGAAPASCASVHVVGARAPSDWWLQARAADNRLWTIGVLGLGGSTPLVQVGDDVTLDIAWRDYNSVPVSTAAAGYLQLSDAAGMPLLWAGADPSASTWISFAAGDFACAPDTGSASCNIWTNVIATVNGSSMTLRPYGTATLGGYVLQVTTFLRMICGDYWPPFEGAAAKVSPMNSP